VNVGCDADSGSHVITGLVRQLSWRLDCSDAVVVAATFLDETHCPAAHDLDDFDKSILRQTRDKPLCLPAAKKPLLWYNAPPSRLFTPPFYIK
jgi:hypothetical protein